MEVFKEVALTGVLPSLTESQGVKGMICIVNESSKGMQYRLACQGLLSASYCQHHLQGYIAFVLNHMSRLRSTGT